MLTLSAASPASRSLRIQQYTVRIQYTVYVYGIFIGPYWAICIRNLANVTLDEMELELAKQFVPKKMPDFPDLTIIIQLFEAHLNSTSHVHASSV